MSVQLLERDHLLIEFDGLVDSARAGRGSMIVIGGEAGIGKTAVVEAMRERVRRARYLMGRCDSLSTPRPLGPLHEMAVDRASGMAGPLSDGRPRHAVFDAFLDELRSSLRVTVAVIEDVHWADEATLDLIRFTGRRVADTHAVVVLTYRDDEIGPTHPLSIVLGDLATARSVRRRSLYPLSIEAVGVLAEGTGVDPERVHAVTDGNPFFVTEVLAAGMDDIPVTVGDAVLARAARASTGARRLIEAAAVVPDRAEWWLLERVADPDDDDRRGAVAVGLLVPYEEGVRFRHDLARRAVEAALDPDRRIDLHRRIVEALEAPPSGEADPSRLAHHAAEAGDGARTVRWGRVAAEQAFDAAAYAEAYSHWRRVLSAGSVLPAEERAEVLERHGILARLRNRPQEGVAAFEEALELRTEIGDPIAVGACLTELAVLRWSVGEGEAATRTMDDALGLLGGLPETPELGRALAAGSHLAMLARQADRAVELGSRAVALAERFAEPLTVARALNAMGSAKVVAERPGGEEDLLASAAIGEEQGVPWVRESALSNLGSAFGEVRDFPRAVRYLEQSIEEGARFDLDLSVDYGRAWLSRVRFEQGRWGVASLLAGKALSATAGSPIVPIVALTVQGRIAARRGERPAEATLARAWELAAATGDVQRTWPAAAGLAEAAWLGGDPVRIPGIVGPILEIAGELGVRWGVGELAYWVWRAGDLDAPPEGAAEPYALQISGDWEAAAQAWRVLGCPYEEADALSDGDAEARLEAVRIWEGLGAVPAPKRLRKMLRAEGVSVPRGPRAATGRNPAGLTPRQVEVLALVAEGLTNAAIAERLFISPKTVDHHVSAVLAKLGVTSRGQAAAAAFRLGMVGSSEDADADGAG